MNRATGRVFQRNGGWAYRVEWRENGSRRSKRGGTWRTKGEAQAALRKVLHELELGHLVKEQGTLGEYLAEWLDGYVRSGKVKRSTAASVESHVRVHLVPRIGHVGLNKLTPRHVQSLYADLLADGEARHKSGRGLSAATVRKVHQTLSKALGDGVRFGRVSRNVAALVDLPRVEKPEMEAWSETELAHFLSDVASRDEYLVPIWYLLATTPLRRGELCGLRWSDVDLVEGFVTIRSTRLEVHGEIYEDTPKSAKGRRRLAIDTGAVIGLAALRNAQEEAAHVLGGIASDFVVSDLEGRPLKPESVTRKFLWAAKRAGLKKIRLHSLRHTWASLALQAGTSPHVVAGRLGHSDAGFTLRTYAPFMPNQDRETVELVAGKLSALLGDTFDTMRGVMRGAKVEQIRGTLNGETL